LSGLSAFRFLPLAYGARIGRRVGGVGLRPLVPLHRRGMTQAVAPPYWPPSRHVWHEHARCRPQDGTQSCRCRRHAETRVPRCYPLSPDGATLAVMGLHRNQRIALSPSDRECPLSSSSASRAIALVLAQAHTREPHGLKILVSVVRFRPRAPLSRSLKMLGFAAGSGTVRPDTVVSSLTG
jgi:hypothetical protein